MDQNTTNINDLPVESNPPDNRELPETQLNVNRSREIEDAPVKRVPVSYTHLTLPTSDLV